MDYPTRSPCGQGPARGPLNFGSEREAQRPPASVDADTGLFASRTLFENFPVSLWEQDFSEVLDYLRLHRQAGVEDFARFFEDHPEELYECARRIRVVNVNRATLSLYQADSKDLLIGDLSSSFSDASYEILKEILVVLGKGESTFHSEARIETMTGEFRDVHLHFSLDQADSDGTNQAMALVTLFDITERKQAESTLRDFIQLPRLGRGSTLFQSMVIQIARCLKADAVKVGQLVGRDENHVSLVAGAKSCLLAEGLDYDLAGTPSERVVADRAPYICAEGVVNRFPHARLLRELGVEAYVGVPLFDDKREPLGILAAMFRQPVKDLAFVESCLQVFSSQIEHELVRLQAQESLRNSELRYRNLLENLPVCVTELSLSGEIISMNQTALDLFGLDDQAQIAGSHILKIVEESDRDRISAHLRDVVKGDACTFEFRGEGLAAGREFSTKLSPVYGQDGAISSILGVAEDITGRKQHKLLLEKNRQTLRTVIDTLPDPVWLKDLDGVYLDCNPAFQAFVGKGVRQVFGKTDDEVLPLEVRPAVTLLETGALQRHGPCTGEVRKGDGSDKAGAWYEITAVPIVNSDGTSGTMLCAAHDITQRKQYQRLVRFQALVAELFIELFHSANQLEEKEFLEHALEMLEDLTESRVSFVHRVDMRASSIENLALSRRTREGRVSKLSELSHPVWGREMWAKPLASLAPTIIDVATLGEGRDEANAEFAGLHRMAILPIVENDEVVVLFGIANRDIEYTEPEVEVLQFFTNSVWRSVQRRRAEVDASKFNWVLEKSLNEIYICDRDTLRIEHVNESALRNLEYGPEEMLGKTLSDIMPRHSKSALTEHLEELKAGLVPNACFRAVHRRKDGSMYPTEVTLQLLEQQPGYVVVMANDIGEHIQMEHELQKLALAVEQSPVSILITNTRGETEYVNEWFTHATGFTREEMAGRSLGQLMPAKGKSDADESQVLKTLKSGQTWEGETHGRRKDGTQITQRERISPIRQEDGTVTHYLSIREDITEKTRLLRELQEHREHLEDLVEQRTRELVEARMRAEAAGKVKSQFLANMSHEIRTPLNAVLGLTYLLQNSPLSPAQRSKLVQIRASTQHLLNVISDILDLSKIEAGKLVLEQQDFHVLELFEHVSAMLGEQAESKGLKLVLGDCSALPPFRGDRTRLAQILINYAHNAIKFTERGEIRIAARLLESEPSGVLVRFEVQDTGPGVDPALLPRLFRAFEQADASTARNYTGTGLGLAIARYLAELHGGEAGADSVPGQGSTFWFTAQLTVAEHSQSEYLGTSDSQAMSLIRHHFRGSSVLLVEDNPINMEVACELLHQAALRVDTAGGAAEALTRIREKRYDVILMDIQMPGVDGLEATRRIRGVEGYQEVPILAISASSFGEQGEASLAAGMNDYLSKPVEPDRLYKTVLKWLRKSRGTGSTEASPLEANPGGLAVGTPGDFAIPSPVISTVEGTDVLDRQVLASLLGNDSAKQLEILQKFVEQGQVIIAALRSELEQQSGDPIRFLAHKFKSSAKTVGARILVELSESLEVASQAGEWARVEQLIEASRQALEDVSERLEEA